MTFNGWTKDEFIEYLLNTLIPDLKESGREATAEDFETTVAFLQPKLERFAYVSKGMAIFALKCGPKAVSLNIHTRVDGDEMAIIKHEESLTQLPGECSDECKVFPHSWCRYTLLGTGRALDAMKLPLATGDDESLFDTLESIYDDEFGD